MKIILLLAAFAFANDSYSQAQKLYSQGNFEAAAKSYGDACRNFEAKEKMICQFKEVKALVGSNKIALAQEAESKMLSLISHFEPSDSLFAELSAEDAKLQTMLNQPARAIRSWNMAQESANPAFFPELFVLCLDIASAFPDNGLAVENCNKVKPADTTLISLQRKKIVPLQEITQPAQHVQPAQSTQPAHAKWYIQLGAFGSKENAERLVAEFKKKGVELHISELTERKLFVVRSGFFATHNDAKIYAEQKIAPAEYKIFQ